MFISNTTVQLLYYKKNAGLLKQVQCYKVVNSGRFVNIYTECTVLQALPSVKGSTRVHVEQTTKSSQLAIFILL